MTKSCDKCVQALARKSDNSDGSLMLERCNNGRRLEQSSIFLNESLAEEGEWQALFLTRINNPSFPVESKKSQ